MTKPLTNPAPETLELWCDIAPQGTFRRTRDDGTPYTQLLDTQAFQTLIRAFDAANREILLDYEHRSQLTGDSRAAGWITALRTDPADPATLQARIRFTPGGARAVADRDLRYLSPVWDLDPQGRPLALESVALTNDPYFKQLRPCLNKAGARETHNKTQTQGHAMLKELALLFGLPEDATEADILAAVKAYKEAQDAAALNAEAAKVADANSTKIANKADFIKAYCLNKQAALQTLGAVKAPGVPDKAAAKAPSFTPSTLAGKALNRADFNKALAGLPPSKRQAYYDENIGNVAD